MGLGLWRELTAQPVKSSVWQEGGAEKNKTVFEALPLLVADIFT